MNFFNRRFMKVVDNTDVETTEYVIRFKDIFLVVDERSDGSYSVSWMRSPMGHTPIREYWQAIKLNEAHHE